MSGVEGYSERTRWLVGRMQRLLCAAMDCAGDETARLLEEIGVTHGPAGMYGVCCALAEVVRRLGFPGFEVGDGSLTGDIAFIEQLDEADNPSDQHDLWAARFVTAYMNGDDDTCFALFSSSMCDEETHAGGVIALVDMAASIARQAEAEHGAAS